jgi:tetratricopeptide (TPR) repeat protein
MSYRNKSLKGSIVIIFVIVFVLSIACGMMQTIASNNTIPTVDRNSIDTIVIQTAVAASTQTAEQRPIKLTATATVAQVTLTNTLIVGFQDPNDLSISMTPTWTGGFKPGDPTATPLGSDITDPNFVKGVKAYKANDYQDAISLMTEVIVANPNLAPPYRYRATAYWYLKDCTSGWADIEKALSINPDYASAWVTHGLLEECDGNNQQAIEDYQKALSIDPSLAVAHQNLAVDYYKIGDFENSLEEYNLATAIDPSRSSAWDGAAEALTKLGRYLECVENGTKALEINSEETLAYQDRAYCELEMENYTAATMDYKEYVARDPSDPIGWYNLGISQKNSGDLQGALESYDKTLELNPSYYEALINRGNIYVDLGEYQKALDDFNHALKFGEIPFAYSGRGDAYYWLGNYDKAIVDYHTSLSLLPDNAHCYCFLSLSYFAIGKYQDSINAADASHKIDPACGGAKLLETEARSYYALGNYNQALQYMDQALAVQPYALGYYYRGIMYQAAGRNSEAIQDLQEFLSTVHSTNTYQKEIADAQARLAKLKP